MKRRIYISGPMKNMDRLNEPIFAAVSTLLRALGYDVVNPIELGREVLTQRGLTVFEDLSDVEYIKADLLALESCDALVLLPHWEHSKGVRVELAFADYAGIKVYQSVDHLLADEKAAVCS